MTDTLDATLESLIRRDRRIVVGALTVVVVASWAYLLGGSGMGMSALEMTGMAQPGSRMVMPMMMRAEWTSGYAALMFFMWWIMMLAMMLPSAAPMILIFAQINRTQRERGHPHYATSVFASGYLIAWAVFSAVATALQWAFERSDLLAPTLVRSNEVFGGALLLAAGVYQLTPVKHACLRHCRSPLEFLSHRWRSGSGGTIRMGLEHGAYCVGCCWFLMGLLFFGGVMNLYWIIGLALFVLLEKVLPAGHRIGYAAGGVLSLWGLVVLADAS